MRRLWLWVIALCFLGLSSCGTKGDLYMPAEDGKPKTDQAKMA